MHVLFTLELHATPCLKISHHFPVTGIPLILTVFVMALLLVLDRSADKSFSSLLYSSFKVIEKYTAFSSFEAKY